MPSPIREELEKHLKPWRDDGGAELSECTAIRRAFLAGLKASLLAGLEKKPPFRGCNHRAKGGQVCLRCAEKRGHNAALSAHTAKVEEIIKDLEG